MKIEQETNKETRRFKGKIELFQKRRKSSNWKKIWENFVFFTCWLTILTLLLMCKKNFDLKKGIEKYII